MLCNWCQNDRQVVFCEGCDMYFCDNCWQILPHHKTNKPGPGGIPHSKSDPRIVEKVKQWMAEPQNEEDEHEQHENDEDSLWFGVSKDGEGNPILEVYRRYAAIMMDTFKEGLPNRYPGLVSVVGQTGAGKSTLIRLLIDPVNHPTSVEESGSVAVPILGRSDCDVPTSSDVHLYIDPKTQKSDRPILLADCEGFEGGERDPIAQAVTVGRHHASAKGRRSLSRVARASKINLKWASRKTPDHERTSKRQYAVTEMYPRIFHAFSDVIVFVLNNPKTLEDVFEKLLKWAHANHSASINLPSKPHAVIAINKSSNSTPNSHWSSATATDEAFKSMDAQLQKNKTFQKYAAQLAGRREIDNLRQLFECYYSSVHVVRLPDKSRYELLHEQRDVLYETIQDCCEQSYRKKMFRGMLPDVDQFWLYLSLAFNHFSETLDEPFDYVKASLRHRPPPDTLRDNVLEFVLLVGKKTNLEVEELFAKVTGFIASCIMLDSARKQRQEYPRKQEADSYKSLCSYVVRRYVNTNVQCQYKHEGLFPWRCALYAGTHDEMHQGSAAIGVTRQIGGTFKHKFSPKVYSWENRIEQQLRELHDSGEWRTKDLSDRTRAHCRAVKSFYSQLGTGLSKLTSNSICLCCLFNLAQFRLRCEHFICFECAMEVGHFEGGKTRIRVQCPIDGGEVTTIHTNPIHSGLRVLTLDGGGIRGIVELCTLRAIQTRLGKVPLQEFFDLLSLIKRSTGGIIALAFGHQRLPVDKCISLFRDLVKDAFTPRKGQKLYGIRYIETMLKKSKYRTRTLEDALKRALGEEPLFGPIDPDVRPLKVAVTATTEAGRLPYLLSNYNMATSSLKRSAIEYRRDRPESPDEEVRVWEAARATSAAPGYFKPFERSFVELMDGGILHNNPINIAMEETAKIAFQENLNQRPDIVLSLGTGMPYEGLRRSRSSAAPTGQENQERQRTRVPFAKTLFTLISYQIKLNLDAQSQWERWMSSFSHPDDGQLFRVNPDLRKEPPAMDKVEEIEPLIQSVDGWLAQNNDIDDIARTLVASSFYFGRVGNAERGSRTGVQLRGLIYCRLSENADNIKALGEYLTRSGNP
ncbi:hypothetical protein PFICI_13153 [Pestalotiopsis fici W106-1]|uniref:PNPLA domain-containing protein n=1 Tax=Pestalotiopsis fici (strain W106-1 / CGMCC3.15140) TaxID=1229662 RepID=W3WLM0_PESFW|nr:uncharacterized protein PFICI_13153 [Pestalotiopsis fici W106-1]ETS74669.1 hypothetical protein PFICI_13153 [Pestalotiopsis fici W106-1]